jgi:hypothetical protein
MRRRFLALLFAGSILLAACGGDSDDGDTPAGGDDETLTTLAQTPEELAEDVLEQAEEQVESGAVDELFANAGSGTFTVDGESFEAPVVRCEPFAAFGEPNPDDLNVRALAGSVFVEVDLSNSDGISMVDGTAFDQQHVNVFLSRPGDGVTEQFDGGATNNADGEWIASEDQFNDPAEVTPLPAPPFTIDGNRITGSMTVIQDWPEGATGTAEVTFDLEFPGEIQDCSL